VSFLEYALSKNDHRGDHQQIQISYDKITEFRVADVVAVDIEPKTLPLHATAVRKCYFEIELNAFVFCFHAKSIAADSSICKIDGLYGINRIIAWMIRLGQLQAFLAIAGAGSLTAAAERLGMSQPSLSRALAELEAELGGAAFTRGRSGAKLTDLGLRIMPHAREIYSRLERIHDEAEQSNAIKGRLRVGAIPSASVCFIPQLIARFGRRFQHVEISLFEEPSQSDDRLNEWLRSGTIDLAFVELPFNGAETCELLVDELCAVVPTASALGKSEQVSV
jgi:molybdenum-dependent DNA-binding transcriptional regulator ModE